MPFEPKDFASFADYKTKLKTEEKVVGSNGHFVCYKNVTFKDGTKKPLVLVVGKMKPSTEVTKLMASTWSTVASAGACAVSPEGLILVPEKGTVKPADFAGMGLTNAVVVKDALPSESGESSGEEAQADGSQPTKPDAAEEKKPEVTIGANPVKQFVAQRTALLAFSRDALARMNAHAAAAKQLKANVDPLVAPIMGGKVPLNGAQRFAAMITKYQGDVEAARSAAEATDKADGKHIATERGIKSAVKFGATKEEADRANQEYKGIFIEVTDNSLARTKASKEAKEAFGYMLDDLSVAAEIVGKGALSVETSLEILERLLVKTKDLTTNVSTNYNVDAASFKGKYTNPTASVEEKKAALAQYQQTFETKKAIMVETMAGLDILIPRAIAKIKGYEGEPRIQAIFNEIKALYSEAIQRKREHVTTVPVTEKYLADAEVALG